MTAFVIEKGIPLASKYSKKTSRLMYPFDRMKKGNSFKFPLKVAKKVGLAANYYAKKHGGKFTVRKISKSTARIWKLK